MSSKNEGFLTPEPFQWACMLFNQDIDKHSSDNLDKAEAAGQSEAVFGRLVAPSMITEFQTAKWLLDETHQMHHQKLAVSTLCQYQKFRFNGNDADRLES